MELRIRNMVCRHCISAVHLALEELGIKVTDVSLGHAVIEPESLSDARMVEVRQKLEELGFTLIPDRSREIVEEIKLAVMHHVRDEQECKLKLSACIESHVGMPYEMLSRLFSQTEGRTLERYHILLKVERVKEMLDDHPELTLAEIAFRTGYSSTAHLSRQFKSVAGMTPTQYTGLPMPRRMGLQEI